MDAHIEIMYDGGFPNLCSGNLLVTVNGVRWNFPRYCLSSGGNVWFTKHWEERISSGPWDVNEWPDDFPENLKWEVLECINEEIPWGCCGGCV